MKFRASLASGLLSSVLAASAFAGSDKNLTSETTAEAPVPFRFSAEFDLEQTYIGGADVQRGARDVNDLDEYYSNLRFVFTPRIKFGILRLGAQWERFSFGFPDGGEQLPNTLQA